MWRRVSGAAKGVGQIVLPKGVGQLCGEKVALVKATSPLSTPVHGDREQQWSGVLNVLGKERGNGLTETKLALVFDLIDIPSGRKLVIAQTIQASPNGWGAQTLAAFGDVT